MLNFSKKDWSRYVNVKNEEIVCQEHGFDLLSRMLTVDHTDRITAREAIEHAFFDEVRDFVEDCDMSQDLKEAGSA